jgi:MoaA/NifB/PqqE/SkfB family radical SAM enzyme/predicted hotdog family 3-hydroxylacyl-ACP dehydratase
MSCHSSMISAEFSREEIAEAAAHGRLLSMEIEFSLRCNYRCQYCYVGRDLNGNVELSEEESLSAILQARDLGARKIIILGGEPMIYPKIREMLTFIRGNGLAVEMFTNGTNITPEMAQFLHDTGVKVVLKMNSFEEAIQDELAGVKGAYAIIQTAFKNLRNAGFPSEDHVMAVSTVICAQNLREIVHMWQWLRDQTIIPYFEIMTPQGNAIRNDKLSVDLPTLQKVFNRLAEIDRTRYGYDWDPQPPLAGSYCLRHQFSCLVNAYGYVMPCVGITIPVGNIRDRKLADILKDSEVIGGAAYQLTGDYLASDPLCWKNTDRADAIMKLPAPVDGMIPHQAPMRVVDKIVSVGERVAVIESTIRKDLLFLNEDGTVARELYIELIAQAAAAMNGFRTAHTNGRINGFLIGARNIEVLAPARINDTLSIHVFKATRYGDFGIIEGKILRGEELLARGEIKVWNSNTPATKPIG